MQTHIFPELNKSGGGRIASPKLRQSLEQCEDFAGLEEGVNRYDLLLLVKRTGKAAGFSPRMISLLDYYMAFTRDSDWEQGSRPIVYKALSNIALDMGVSERQIQALEKQLFEIGAITWNDSGNHRRYGQRCEETGQILYAFGVDLTPLAYLRTTLQSKLHEKQLYDNAWRETKRQISYYRAQIRAILAEAQNRAGEPDKIQMLEEADIFNFSRMYDAVATPIRTYIDLETLRALLEKHKALHIKLNKTIEPYDNERNIASSESSLFQKDSPKDDSNCAHYKYTKQKQSNKLDHSRDNPISFQKSVVVPLQDNLNLDACGKDSKRAGEQKSEDREELNIVFSTGLQHVSLKQLLNISTERFRDHLPIEPRPMNHGDFIEAAYRIKGDLGISQSSWGHACLTLGRIGAAVCVILTDQGTLRDENRVTKPGAYFNAMINRAKSGELKLQQSVMGHLKREFGNDDQDVSTKTDQNA